jgi:hypothetical protein
MKSDYILDIMMGVTTKMQFYRLLERSGAGFNVIFCDSRDNVIRFESVSGELEHIPVNKMKSLVFVNQRYLMVFVQRVKDIVDPYCVQSIGMYNTLYHQPMASAEEKLIVYNVMLLLKRETRGAPIIAVETDVDDVSMASSLFFDEPPSSVDSTLLRILLIATIESD